MNILRELQKKYYKAVGDSEAHSMVFAVSVAGVVVSVIVGAPVVVFVGAVGGGVVIAATAAGGAIVAVLLVIYGVFYNETKNEVEKNFRQRISVIEDFLKENNLYTVAGIDWLLENYQSKKGVLGVLSGLAGKIMPVGMFFLGVLFQEVSGKDRLKWIVWIVFFLVWLIFIIVSFVTVSAALSRTRKYLIEDLGYVKTQLSN